MAPMNSILAFASVKLAPTTDSSYLTRFSSRFVTDIVPVRELYLSLFYNHQLRDALRPFACPNHQEKMLWPYPFQPPLVRPDSPRRFAHSQPRRARPPLNASTILLPKNSRVAGFELRKESFEPSCFIPLRELIDATTVDIWRASGSLLSARSARTAINGSLITIQTLCRTMRTRI